MVAQLSQENCRWDGRGRELKPSVERGESGARGESRPPRRAAEACKAGLRGVRVLNRHLG